VILLIAAAAIWLPTVWEEKLYRDSEQLVGVGSHLLEGSVTPARGKVEPGKPAGDIVAALGKPSFEMATEGASRHEIWKYYYPDGTLTINVTDGYVARASVEYGPPKIPTTARP
jgi:hypothetical protein